MQGHCPKCLKSVSDGRYCPYCGYDMMASLTTRKEYSDPITVGQEEIYTAPIDPASLYSDAGQNQSRIPQQAAAPEQKKPRRIRKLPILLAGIACVVAMLILSGKEEPEKKNVMAEYTMPQFSIPETEAAEEESTEPVTTELQLEEEMIFEYEAEDFYASVDHSREMTITLSNLDIQSEYLVNRKDSKDMRKEYSWEVTAHGKERSIKVETRHVFDEDKNQGTQKISIDDMDHLVAINPGTSKQDKDKFVIFKTDGLTMAHDEDSITWKFTFPDENDPSSIGLWRMAPITLDSFHRFEVVIKDADSGTSNRLYFVK